MIVREGKSLVQALTLQCSAVLTFEYSNPALTSSPSFQSELHRLLFSNLGDHSRFCSSPKDWSLKDSTRVDLGGSSY